MSWVLGKTSARGTYRHWLEDDGRALCGNVVSGPTVAEDDSERECRTCGRMLATQRLDAGWFDRHGLPVPDRMVQALTGRKGRKF